MAISDILDMEGITIDVLEEMFNNPKSLGNATPDDWYRLFILNGYTPKPLGKGNYRNIPYENGGGYRVHWGGDRIFQYHPAKRTHHGNDSYYKLSSGLTGILRFDLDGNTI